MAIRYGYDTTGRTIWRVESDVEPGHELICSACKRALPYPETFTRGTDRDPFAVVCRSCRPHAYAEILYKGRMVICQGAGRLLVDGWPEDPRGVQVEHVEYGPGFIEKAATADLVWVRYWDKDRPGLLASRVNAHIQRTTDLFRRDTVEPEIVEWVLRRLENGQYVPEGRLTVLRVNRAYNIWINQGWRECGILGVIPSEYAVLGEYVMPNGSSTLKRLELVQDLETYSGIVPSHRELRSMSYFRLPKKWLRAVCEGAGEWWYGEPQQTRKRPKEPLEIWRARYPDEPYPGGNGE